MTPISGCVCTRMVCVVVASFVLAEAAGAYTVTGSTTFDYGTFVSQYVRLESSTFITWFQAVDACWAYGTGWDIAGIYSAAGNAAVQTMFSTTTGTTVEGYIGGYYPSPSVDVSPNWLMWYGGRFQGKPISSGLYPSTCLGAYCNYRAGEPNASPCTAADGETTLRERALNIYSDGTWNDINPEGCPGYSNAYNAAICERSACSIQVDCEPANTASISGVYAPSCTCTCKTGYRGARCQVLDTTVTANGTDYGAWCDASPMNATVAQSRCITKGSGWTLASIPTSGVDAMIRGLTTNTMWTGGTYETAANKYKWQHGRYAGMYFSNAPGAAVPCVTGMYCNWAPGEPNRADCLDGSPLEKDIVTGWRSTQQWNDLWANVCSLRTDYNVHCYVCEQNPCLQKDCAKGYHRPRGYYPSCTCTTISATLSLTAMASVSASNPLTLTDTLKITTSVSLSQSPSTSAPNTFSIPSTNSVTMTASTSPTTSLSESLSTTTSPTSTPSSSVSLSPTPSVSASYTNLGTSSITIAPTTSLSHSTSMSLTTTHQPSNTMTMSHLTPTTSITTTRHPSPTTTPSQSSSRNATNTQLHSISISTSYLTPSISDAHIKTQHTTTTFSKPSTTSPTNTKQQSPSIYLTSFASSKSAATTTTLYRTLSLPESTTSSPTTTQVKSASITHSYIATTATPSFTTLTLAPSPPQAIPMTDSLSPNGLTQTSTHTEEHTESSTYAANTTLVAQMLARFPLFTDVVVDDNAVRSGLARSLTPTHNSTALWELLAEAGARRVRVTGIPIFAAVPALGPVGVTGNEGGFFRAQPNTTLLMPNSTTLDLTLSALSQYSITVGERLLLYTSMRELLDVSVLTDLRDVDELHLVGTIVVSKGDTGMSGPSIVTTVVTGGGGALGGMAPELQGVGALALMGCSDPNTKSSFGSYRVLSPVAVQDSYAGVIIGNALLTGAVGVVQLGIVLVLRFCRRVQRTVEQMATARFPSFFIAAALAFHTGTAFASAQLISQPGNYAGWEVFVGVAGFVYSLALPVAMAAHPYLRVGRAYQEYSMAEWLGARRWPAWIVWVVPRGALFSLQTRQAYGLYLSAYRAPPRHLFWTSLPTWTPLVFLVAGLFHPNTVPGCRAQFACMGIAMVAIAALVVWRAPLRAHMAGWLDTASRLALGCVMFCMGAAIVDGDKLNAQASDAAYAFIVVLMAITALRVMHHLLCMYTDYRMERDAVPLETVWTHVLGGNRKKTLQFHNMEDDSLRGIAGDRDAAMEIDMPLVGHTSDDDSDVSQDEIADHVILPVVNKMDIWSSNTSASTPSVKSSSSSLNINDSSSTSTSPISPPQPLQCPSSSSSWDSATSSDVWKDNVSLDGL